MNPVLEALNFRHACKRFAPDRKIPEQTLRDIMACAHLSPSSFGLEPWKFLVIEDSELRQRLRPACWNQAQITDSSAVVVILARSETLRAGEPYVREGFARKGLDASQLETALGRFRAHQESEVLPRMNLYAWASKQCYIALANIMTAAASVGVDSCPIEGFEKNAVDDVLALAGAEFETAVLVALGYRAGEQTPRYRYDFDNIVEFR